jgi:alkylhydroperoxidase family enzyme
MALVLGRMDLRNRAFEDSFERVAAALPAHVDRASLAPLRARPQLLEAIRLSLDERDLRSSLGRATLARVHAAVEAALPTSAADVQGAHQRPTDPELAFAFVGTRYAHRTTADMIEGLRRKGYDDLGILDLAIAVADANQWARTRRLLDLPAAIHSLALDNEASHL